MSIQSFTPQERAEHVNGAPLWLQSGEDSVYAVLHSPAPAVQRNTAVLILPPFGWEEMCSYRSRRQWAIELAQAGFPAARIDLPATGDSSGSPSDADLLHRWDVAARAALDWLRGLKGISRVAVIGIRLGGMLAIRALASGAEVDDLVLWGVPARGRTYLRELRVHSEVVASASGSHEEQERIDTDGTLALTGFVLKPETVASLEAVDLAALPLPDLGGRRALLIERDGLGVDRKLNTALKAAGAETQTLPASDYRLMMTGPLEPGTPRESIAKTIDWITAAAGPADWADHASSSRLAHPLEETTMVVNGVRLSERLLSYEGRAGTMVGVLTRPADHEPLPVCVVLLGAGRRIGPNRMWVETARRWAALGAQSVRFDIEGLGDSDGNGDLMNVERDLYAPRMAGNVKELIDRLEEMGIADRFVMVGLCSSAYWSFRAAVDEPRIVGATLVNQWAFDYNERLVAERARARTGEVLRKGMLKRMVKGVWQGWIGMSELRRTIRAFRPGARRAGSEEAAQHQSVQSWLSTLAAHGTDVAMIFSIDEPLYEQIVRFGYNDRLTEWPSISIEQAPVRDHNIRALGAQAQISDRVDAAIRRQLALDSDR